MSQSRHTRFIQTVLQNESDCKRVVIYNSNEAKTTDTWPRLCNLNPFRTFDDYFIIPSVLPSRPSAPASPLATWPGKNARFTSKDNKPLAYFECSESLKEMVKLLTKDLGFHALTTRIVASTSKKRTQKYKVSIFGILKLFVHFHIWRFWAFEIR